MKRANLIPSVLFGAILVSIIITSPEAENLELPGTTFPQVVEFSGDPAQQSETKLQSVRPVFHREDSFTPYSQHLDNYETKPALTETSLVAFSLQAG